MSEVKFIRVRGRIVPIKKKEEESALKTYAKGVGLSVSGGLLGQGLVKNQSKEVADIDLMRKKYSKLFKNAGNPDILQSDVKGAFAYYGGGKNLNLGTSSSMGVEINRKSVILGTMKDEATLLHELGHLRSSKKKGSFNYLNRMQNVFIEKMIRKNKIGAVKSMVSIRNTIAPITNLFSELEASAVATKHAFKYGGAKTGLKVAGKLSGLYSTYALAGAGAIVSTYGIYKGLRNLHKSQLEKKK
jgi:hypothetical protein